MQVYEANIQYSLVRVGNDEPLNTPTKIVEYMTGAFDDAPMQESFYVVCLNRENRPICRHRISLGTVSNTLVHPREVFRIAVLASASAIVAVHNHPSGDPSPSAPDLAVTRQFPCAAPADHAIILERELAMAEVTVAISSIVDGAESLIVVCHNVFCRTLGITAITIN
jgi:DNA repair protein RadC